jgi:hypothetical protein
MTIKELYEWAKKNNCEEYEVEIQYRDSGGCYNGTDDLRESEIVINSNGVVII